MKKILFSLLLAAAAVTVQAQSAEVSTDMTGQKVLRGFMTRAQVEQDPAFPWFAENFKDYTPPTATVDAFKAAKDSIHILAFAGTWCPDTKYVLPRFYALTDAAGLTADRVTLVGVDRDKKTVHSLAEAFNVVNVPTLIVLKNGKEIGRVVEYGTTGQFDKELGEIVGKK